MSDKIEIIKGDDVKIDVFVQNESQSPYSLANVTEAKACFIKDDDTSLELTLTGGAIVIEDAAEGHLRITIGDADTALLKANDEASFELQIDESGDKQSFQFIEVLDIKERLC